jgi:hypothetical protein
MECVMAENKKVPRPAEVTAEAKVKIRIRRLDKIETARNIASNSSGN